MAVISLRNASLCCSIDCGRLLFTFDLGYYQRKNRTDLNQVNGRANRCHHAMKLNDQETSPSKSPSHVEKCRLLHHPVEIEHCLYHEAYSILV